jgi:type I site-specific restriction endonuclease
MDFIVPLSFPPTPLDLTRKSGKVFVKCLIRKKAILLTPEEWVRQHIIAHLINDLNYPKTLVGVEKSIQYNGLTKRWDIVVFDSDFKPYLLVECKAPNIKLGTNTLQQALSYQHQLNCELIVISNGLETHTWQLNKEKQSLEKLDGIPCR